MPSFLLENGRLLLASAPRETATPADFIELGAVDADARPRLDADFPSASGAAVDVLAGFRGDLVLTYPTQAAAIQAAIDRLRTQMQAAAPAGRQVELDSTSPLHWVRVTPEIHLVIGYAYDAAGATLRHWSYDHPTKPFRSFVCFEFSLRQISALP